ncbi:helix-turn-helix transcriptional regulator [uncultured Cohaesibacter sp.]|uniref:helix-turn-helix domain-containing protein n=1 Tax=uncultured Cohaesibacter sp. TaxID=1002546 RepID=UPI0029C6251C|nr:helix-turn-helix transcriptional regulator [uncultured Cohaesibacter sp.]
MLVVTGNSMISKILTLIRENEGLTLQDTAQRLGISPEEVLDYETGRKAPSEGIIEEYSNIFGVPVASIEFFSEHDIGGVIDTKHRLFFADKIVKLVEKLMESKD